MLHQLCGPKLGKYPITVSFTVLIRMGIAQTKLEKFASQIGPIEIRNRHLRIKRPHKCATEVVKYICVVFMIVFVC